MEILYEDNHVIAVVKPAGVRTQPDVVGQDSMLERVREYIRVTYNKPGNVFVGLVHRLDRNTTGIIVFAKTSKGASRLSEQIRDGIFEKEYTALVSGRVKPASKKLEHFLFKDNKEKKAMVTKSAQKGKQARLQYSVVETFDHASLLEIKLETGRFHQIRAQMAAYSYPLVGDTKYGGPMVAQKNFLGLAATKLKFNQVVTQEPITLEMPYPSAWQDIGRKL